MVLPRTWEELALNSGSLASDQRFFLPVPWLIAAGGRLRFALGVSRKSASLPRVLGQHNGQVFTGKATANSHTKPDCCKNLISKEHFGGKNPPISLMQFEPLVYIRIFSFLSRTHNLEQIYFSAGNM